MVSPEDFRLLCVKFADPTTGDINYPAFVQTVDKGASKDFASPSIWGGCTVTSVVSVLDHQS